MYSKALHKTRPYCIKRAMYANQTIAFHAPFSTASHSFIKTYKPLRPILDPMIGSLWNNFWKLTTSAFPLFLLRFKLSRNETLLFTASRQRAHAAFFNAYNNVPAYKQHIGSNIPETFNDIPETVKEKYIKPYVETNQIHQTLMHGRLPIKGQIDTSTGTSGRPTPWVRGAEEIKTVCKLASFATQVVIGNQHCILINAFALGPWATGITVSNIMRKRALVFSTGPDKEKILNILQQFNPNSYPDLKYVISGYPPFMKDLVETAIKSNIDIDKYQIIAVVGGEEISDTIRQQAMGLDRNGKKVQPGFSKVISTYGASDLDINIGYESDFEIALRGACRKNPALAKDLLGENETIPMMFHYDPLNYYVETNQNKELIFTCVRDDRVSPRIRYNLQDRGKVMPLSEVLSSLDKHNVRLPKPNTHLPLLFIWGRDGVINYRGSKVPASHLEEAINNTPELAGKVQNFAFNSYEKNNITQMEVWLEFKSEININDINQNLIQIEKKLISNLADINQDFKFQLVHAPDNALPVVKTFSFGQSLMSNQDPQRKKKYLFHVASMTETENTGPTMSIR